MVDRIEKLNDVIDELERQSKEIDEFYQGIKLLKEMQKELKSINMNLDTGIKTNADIALELNPLSKNIVSSFDKFEKEIEKLTHNVRTTNSFLKEIDKKIINSISRDIHSAQNNITLQIDSYNEKISSQNNKLKDEIIHEISTFENAISSHIMKISKNQKKFNVVLVSLSIVIIAILAIDVFYPSWQ